MDFISMPNLLTLLNRILGYAHSAKALKNLSHIMLECSFAKILQRNSPWTLLTSAFCEQPFAAWIVAVLRPHLKLAIPIQEVHKFQLQAAITMDHIWFSRNQLVHQAVIPSPMQSLTQIASTSAEHCKAWTDSIASSIWSPCLPGSTKASFDVALSSTFAVAAMVVSDSNGNIIEAATKKMHQVKLMRPFWWFKLQLHVVLTFLSLKGMLLIQFLIFNNCSCLKVGVFLMLFLTFSCICFLFLAEMLRTFLGVLTLEYIVWLNGLLFIG